MTNGLHWIAIGVAAAATVSAGYVQGRLTNRWGTPQRLIEAGVRLDQVAIRTAHWELKTKEKLSEGDRNMLECAGAVVRTYVHRTTGTVVSVAVLVGPSGPIAVHTPEICFSSRNYQLIEDREPVKVRDVAGIDHELWVVTFRSTDLDAALMRVYYAWTVGSAWSASKDPRFEFGTSPYLYKLQLAAMVSTPGKRLEDEAVYGFLQEFLPTVKAEMLDASQIN